MTMGMDLQIPIFPLGSVLYPNGVLPLRIFEQRYLEMTKTCIRDDSVFGICLIREGNEVGAPAVPYDTGCTARIGQWDMPHLGMFHLVVQGESVFRIQEQWISKSGLLQAQVRLEPALRPEPLADEHAGLAQLLTKIMAKLGPDRFPAPTRLDDATWVAFRLAELLPLELGIKQRLLETRDSREALGEIKTFLQAREVAL